MKIKVKKIHPEAKLPTRGSAEAAGYDLHAVSMVDMGVMVSYDTGLAVEIPKGYVGLIFPRSGIYKKALTLANSVGVIDSDYRGEIKFNFRKDLLKNFSNPDVYGLGDRIGQLVIIKHEELDFEEVDMLSSTDRGDKGFGSTGK